MGSRSGQAVVNGPDFGHAVGEIIPADDGLSCLGSELPAEILLRDNLLIYGLGGLIVPFIGIKVIDLMLAALGLV